MSNPIIIITPEPLSQVIARAEPVSTVLVSSGGGGNGNLFRGIINFDGGHAGTKYGDLVALDGGGAADGRRYSI